MFTFNNHKSNDHKNSTLILSFVLSLTLSFALSAPKALADNHQMMQQSYGVLPHGTRQESQSLCDKMRMARQQEINRNPDIELLVSLRKSSDANCFSPAENLYYVSLVAAEEQLGVNAPWYESMGGTNEKKAGLACEVMGYDDSPLSMTMEECISARYDEMMRPYNDEYRQESADYINKRNALGEQLVEQCVTAFYQNLPQLPRQIQFPLAYYDRKLHSYPDWYLQARMNDTNWLLDMQNTMASQVISDALKKQCPGDMIWWLYLST